jgi:hypothetical protein
MPDDPLAALTPAYGEDDQEPEDCGVGRGGGGGPGTESATVSAGLVYISGKPRTNIVRQVCRHMVNVLVEWPDTGYLR